VTRAIPPSSSALAEGFEGGVGHQEFVFLSPLEPTTADRCPSSYEVAEAAGEAVGARAGSGGYWVSLVAVSVGRPL